MSRLHLIDGNAYVHRAYHALPPMQRPSDGLPCNAVHGFCDVLWRLSKQQHYPEGPTHACVVFDPPGANFRNEIYPQYKAHRPPKPEAMRPQLPLMRDVARAFNISQAEVPRYEADDVIATYARLGVEAGWEVVIVTGDKDMMQLVGGPVSIFNPMDKRRVGPAEVEEKFGVPPERVVDVLALMGDASDNVPGCPGVGIKTAARLITEFGDLDTLLENVERVKQPKLRESLYANAADIIMSRALVRLADDAPVEDPVDSFECRPIDMDPLREFLELMEFHTLLSTYTRQLEAA